MDLAFKEPARGYAHGDVYPWLERAKSSLVTSFADGVLKDKAVVAAAISSAWPTGQTEGQIAELKQ